MSTTMPSELTALLVKSARRVGQRVAAAHLDKIEQHVGQANDHQNAAALFTDAWSAAELRGLPAPLYTPATVHLPFVAHHAKRGWSLVQSRASDGDWRCESARDSAVFLTGLDDATCLSLPHRSAAAFDKPDALRLVTNALWARKGVFIDAGLATGLITLLTMGASLFSMQVYDRVIPNQGFNTLWVLAVGVVLSICLEFALKQVRSHSVDHACKAIDQELSEWFFKRMLGIRMGTRPASIGTLASQIKGFEMVRGVLASTSIFVLTDVPFALVFLMVIALVGGWLVAVPLVALPIALGAGLLFQRNLQRHAEANLAWGNQKAGLLVEAVDGAESLKANSAEWTLLARWRHLIGQAGEAEQHLKNHTALSQNITASLQQLAYVALVTAGACMVADHQMTMGALMACSIISNRALMPIVQLPGVMVQWAQARAAIQGLDQVIALPNEADDAQNALAPQVLAAGLQFERAGFAYGQTTLKALEIDRLGIKAGECVGLVGAIGSGKSTLLKLACGMYRPTQGQVFLGGSDMALLEPSMVREMVGYLPQDARLFSGHLRDNLVMGLPDPGDQVILEAARRTGLIDLILGQPKGLALAITEGGRGVSGGQKQLIAVTRMLLAKPKIWLLDEPTGAMDSVTEARVVGLLRELAAEGATLVVSTHKTAVLPLMSRLIVLHQGRILIDGPRDHVLDKLSCKTAAPRPEGVAT